MGELDDILGRLEPSLGPLGEGPTPLQGGITNRNYRVVLGSSEYVLRLHGRETELLGISRRSERMANEAAAGLGIAPAVAEELEGALVTRFIACRPAGPADVAERVDDIAGALRAFHECDLSLPVSFWVPDLMGEYARIMAERGAHPNEEYEQAAAVAARIGSVVGLDRPRPCHNDLLAGNILLASEGGGIMIVDWEYAGMGHPLFDLGNLAVNNELDEAAEGRLLAAYRGDEPSPLERATLKLMRVLSDAREGAWGALQALISELDFDFEGYARDHFARLREAVDGREFDRWIATVEALAW